MQFAIYWIRMIRRYIGRYIRQYIGYVWSDEPDLVHPIRANADNRAAWCCSNYLTGEPHLVQLIVIMKSNKILLIKQYVTCWYHFLTNIEPLHLLNVKIENLFLKVFLSLKIVVALTAPKVVAGDQVQTNHVCMHSSPSSHYHYSLWSSSSSSSWRWRCRPMSLTLPSSLSHQFFSVSSAQSYFSG